ncbi:hypothetical protein ACNFIA_25585 [Pseudomonas sp. NY15437]|uniref:hypothetical protein n=1 Tax=Pseudomonas sp. NY15437 TaxID=3400360 RepID=UPI003A8381C3
MRDGSGDFVDELLISESAVYAALIQFFHPENRSVRQWLSQQVIPTLRDQHRTAPGEPRREMLRGPTEFLSVLKWQGVLWVPYRHWPELSARLESGA